MKHAQSDEGTIRSLPRWIPPDFVLEHLHDLSDHRHVSFVAWRIEAEELWAAVFRRHGLWTDADDCDRNRAVLDAALREHVRGRVGAALHRSGSPQDPC